MAKVARTKGVHDAAGQRTDAPEQHASLAAQPITYLVLVATKQLREITENIKNPEAMLIIAGSPTPHPPFAGSAVSAT